MREKISIGENLEIVVDAISEVTKRHAVKNALAAGVTITAFGVAYAISSFLEA